MVDTGGGADAPVRVMGRDTAQFGNYGGVEHVLVDRSSDAFQIENGAARQHHEWAGEGVERVLGAMRTKITFQNRPAVPLRARRLIPCGSIDSSVSSRRQKWW